MNPAPTTSGIIRVMGVGVALVLTLTVHDNVFLLRSIRSANGNQYESSAPLASHNDGSKCLSRLNHQPVWARFSHALVRRT
jgi:hypothetical protein